MDNIPRKIFFKPSPSRLRSSKPAVKCGWFFQLSARQGGGVGVKMGGGHQCPFSIEASQLEASTLEQQAQLDSHLFFPNMHHGALILLTHFPHKGLTHNSR